MANGQTDAGAGLAYNELFVQKPISSKAFFDGLAKRATKKAHQLALAKAESMQHTLNFRNSLGKGWGKWPKWQPRVGEWPKQSNRSFAGWHIVKKDAGIYHLRNDVGRPDSGRWDGYAYPRNLAKGTYWSKTANVGKQNGRLVMAGNKIFSKQMPKGLSPWLRFKRNELKDEITKQLRKKK